MHEMTKEQFEEQRRVLRQDGDKGNCPIWSGFPAQTRQVGDFAGLNLFWSPRAGGLFRCRRPPVPLIQIPDEETRKRISSWIWERNSAFETTGKDEENEVPELTNALIWEMSKRAPLSIERRIDRGPACHRPATEFIGCSIE